MSKPKIYGFCDAGCKFETVHKDDIINAIPIKLTPFVTQSASKSYTLGKSIDEAKGKYKLTQTSTGAVDWGMTLKLYLTQTIVTVTNPNTNETTTTNTTSSMININISKTFDSLKPYCHLEILDIVVSSSIGSGTSTCAVTVEVDGARETLYGTWNESWTTTNITQVTLLVGGEQFNGVEILKESYDEVNLTLVVKDVDSVSKVDSVVDTNGYITLQNLYDTYGDCFVGKTGYDKSYNLFMFYSTTSGMNLTIQSKNGIRQYDSVDMSSNVVTILNSTPTKAITYSNSKIDELIANAGGGIVDLGTFDTGDTLEDNRKLFAKAVMTKALEINSKQSTGTIFTGLIWGSYPTLVFAQCDIGYDNVYIYETSVGKEPFRKYVINVMGSQVVQTGEYTSYSKQEVDDIVGDINTILDNLNGEVI